MHTKCRYAILNINPINIDLWYYPKVIFHQLFFIRHAETTYSNIYPDITGQGAIQLRKTAKEIRPLITSNPKACITIVASPAMRAQGSASVLANSLGYTNEIITETLLSDMGYVDWPKARQIFEQCQMNGERIEDIYEIDDRFEDVHIFEPRSSVQTRFYRYMRKCHDALSNASKSQCIVVVSHFEILNHFLKNLWPDAPWLQWANYFTINYETSSSSQDFTVTVSYAGKTVSFQPEKIFKFPRILLPIQKYNFENVS